jgi:hypothetical protein
MMRAMTDAHPSDAERTSLPVGAHASSTASDEVDRRIVAGQIGREPRAMAGVAARCVFGLPAVTRQSPTDEHGRPFPTAFYLTCPFLVKQIDRLESTGAVRRYEQRLQDDPELLASTARSHDRHAALDDRGSNIAASGDRAHVKCLHAHAAFELALGDHPLGRLALAESAPTWCDDARCTTLAGPTQLVD